MNFGGLTQRIRIERPVRTTDPVYGTPVTTWSVFAAVPASVLDSLPSKAETSDNQIKIASRPCRIRTRYIEGITSDMRVVMLERGNRLMQITTQPAELGRKEGLEFMAEDYTSAGDGA